MVKITVSLCLLTFAFCHLPCRLWADPLAENQARFGIITGDVGLLAQGAPEWIEPHEGLPIEPGDDIRTGENGRVELIMSQNVVWVLEPETDLVTEHMDTNTGRFSLSSGTLMGIVDSSRTAGIVQQWEFNTPAAVVGISGTEFAIEFSKAEGSRLGVFEGKVDMEPAETAEGLQPPVQVTMGHEAVAKRGRPLRTSGRFSPWMHILSEKLPALRRRQKQIEETWSPFTTTVRKELRLKFVAPPPKVKRNNPRPLKRKIPVENSDGSL
jgi:hypothetical protein